MLKKLALMPNYDDCGCGCLKFAEPPKSCKVCEFACQEVDGCYCTLGRWTLAKPIATADPRWCPNRGRRKDCEIRKRHAVGLAYDKREDPPEVSSLNTYIDRTADAHIQPSIQQSK